MTIVVVPVLFSNVLVPEKQKESISNNICYISTILGLYFRILLFINEG